jgi:drug/metabolite transporter (DMT)-like permease
MSRTAVLFALLAAALFGAAAPAGKVLLRDFSAFQLAGLLYLGAAVGVTPLLVRGRGFGRLPWQMDRTTLFRLSVAIALGGIVGPVLLLFALDLSSAASVSMWLNLELAATALLGVVFFRDHLTAVAWIAVVGTLVAAVIVASAEGAVGAGAGALVAAACLSWAADNQLTSLIDGIPPAATAFWKGLVAGSVNLAIGIASAPYGASWTSSGAAVGIGAVAYGASLVLYITAAQSLGATRNQIVFSTAPFFGVGYSAILLGEGISSGQWLAAVLLAGAITLLSVDRHSHRHRHGALAHEHLHRHDDGHHSHRHGEAPRSLEHSHRHEHGPLDHSHPHWPDLHHRHEHGREGE